MRKYLSAFVGLLALVGQARAADSTVSALTDASALGGTELFYCVQSAADRKCTPAQINTYVQSLWGTGVATFLATPSSANLRAALTDEVGTGAAYFVGGALGTPASGTATNLTGLPISTGLTGAGTGVLAALGTAVGSAGAPVLFNGALGTPSSGTLTNATGLPIATGVSGLGTGVATALAAAMNGSTGPIGTLTPTNNNCVVGNGAAWTSASCPGGGSGVTNLAIGGGLVSATNAACSQTTISAGGSTISAAECVNAQVGTTYTFLESDRAKLVTASNTASQAYTLPQSTASAFVSGWTTRFKNINTGPVVITPTTSTINGAASLTVLPNVTVKITADGTNYTASFEAPTALPVQTVTGTNPALISSYYGSLIYLSNAANQVPTLAQAGTAGFPTGWYSIFCNINAGTQTITPTTSTIGGASTFIIPAGTAAAPKCVGVQSDGTNYNVAPYFFRFGTNVETAAAATLSSAGGLTTTVGSTTLALSTSAISSATCTAAQTATMTGLASTDVLLASFNGDPTAVTGYVPATAGMLTIIVYPTTDTANVKVCNNTTGSITPGAITLNLRAVR